MVNELYSIVWTKRSMLHLKQIHDYISEKSTQNAAKVIEDIFNEMNKAVANPEIYNADKFKTNNDGSYRSFEKHHYRVTYRFHQNVIRVLRIRHTSMEPKLY